LETPNRHIYFLRNCNELNIKIILKNNPKIKLVNKIKGFFGGTNNDEITPAANHATEIFPKISAICLR